MVKLNKIYTRTGDNGETGLVGGARRAKQDARMEAIGDVDEVNSLIGLARLHVGVAAHDDMLRRIQHDLFDLGADLATLYAETLPEAAPSGQKHEPLRIVPSQVSRLEQEMDRLNEQLAPLDSFVLPGGTPASCTLHLARTVTRRSERHVCALSAREPVNPVVIHYLNRLSDFLFVLARAGNNNGAKDVLWQPGINR